MSEILSFPHEIEETTRAVQIHIYPQSGLYKRVQGGDVRLLHDDYNNVLGIEHLTIMPSRKNKRTQVRGVFPSDAVESRETF